MVTFHVPTHSTEEDPLVFRVPAQAVLFAGSRRGHVPPDTASLLVASLSQAGLSFLTGCASGVDASIRHTLSLSEKTREHSFIACAFPDRVCQSLSKGLFASVVVPDGLSPAAALRRRTLWMVKRCVLLILFPDDPATGRWGRGSTLAFRSTLDQLKPVFVVTRNPPRQSHHYRLIPDSLYGAVDGYWVVPHPVEAGTCDEEW